MDFVVVWLDEMGTWGNIHTTYMLPGICRCNPFFLSVSGGLLFAEWRGAGTVSDVEGNEKIRLMF